VDGRYGYSATAHLASENAVMITVSWEN
jgi:hypothetical protein